MFLAQAVRELKWADKRGDDPTESMRNKKIPIMDEFKKLSVLVTTLGEEDRELGGKDDRNASQSHENPEDRLGP